MSEVLQLNQQSENTYEFNLEIDGLETVDVKAWLIIKVKGMELSFPCKQDKLHFTCDIAPIPFIERATYSACIRLVSDGYYFEVVSDLMVNVIGNLNFTENDVKNMKLTSTVKPQYKEKPTNKKDDGKKKPVKEATVVTKTERIQKPADIAAKLLKEAGTTPEMAKAREEELDQEVSQFISEEQKIRDEKVRNILKGFQTSKENPPTPTKATFVRKN